jgi:hypothetical protein
VCLRGSAAGAACTASKHAVVGLTKNSAAMYGAKGLRFNALGALTQANIPAPATAAELAAPTTFLLGGDDTNVSGAIRASDGGEAPPSCALLHCSGDLNYIRRQRAGLHGRHKGGGSPDGGNATSHVGRG